jgi:hypothetical protein
MVERRANRSRRIVGLMLCAALALTPASGASADDECCTYRGGTSGRSTIELSATTMRYVSRWRQREEEWWSNEIECARRAEQIVCTGGATYTFTVAFLVEEDFSPFRVRLLEHPCVRHGRTHPVTALITFDTADPFFGDASEQVFCGNRMLPI